MVEGGVRSSLSPPFTMDDRLASAFEDRGGTDLKTTSAILGHSDASTTLRIYSHVLSEARRSAVNVIDYVLQRPIGKDPNQRAG